MDAKAESSKQMGVRGPVPSKKYLERTVEIGGGMWKCDICICDTGLTDLAIAGDWDNG